MSKYPVLELTDWKSHVNFLSDWLSALLSPLGETMVWISYILLLQASYPNTKDEREPRGNCFPLQSMGLANRRGPEAKWQPIPGAGSDWQAGRWRWPSKGLTSTSSKPEWHPGLRNCKGQSFRKEPGQVTQMKDFELYGGLRKPFILNQKRISIWGP